MARPENVSQSYKPYDKVWVHKHLIDGVHRKVRGVVSRVIGDETTVAYGVRHMDGKCRVPVPFTDKVWLEPYTEQG